MSWKREKPVAQECRSFARSFAWNEIGLELLVLFERKRVSSKYTERGRWNLRATGIDAGKSEVPWFASFHGADCSQACCLFQTYQQLEGSKTPERHFGVVHPQGSRKYSFCSSGNSSRFAGGMVHHLAQPKRRD